VEFPSVTVCSSGRVEENIRLAFFDQLTEFLNSHNQTNVYSAWDIVDAQLVF
jgi:hypothetical protein